MSQRRTEQLAVPGAVTVIVAAHLAALLVFPDGVSTTALAGLAGVSGVTTAIALTVAGESRAWAAGTGGTVLVATAVGGALTTVSGLRAVAVGVVAVAVSLSYLTHRYERLTLGLLEDVNE